jgi:hypothetical protein
MNFYYDPILGLQYTYLGDLFLIDVDALPSFDVEQWMKYMRQTGLQIVESGTSPIIERILNITEYRL